MHTRKGFRTLPPERARPSAATQRHFERGATVFAEGQPSDSVWAVKDGLVSIVKHGGGDRELVAEVIPPGALPANSPILRTPSRTVVGC